MDKGSTGNGRKKVGAVKGTTAERSTGSRKTDKGSTSKLSKDDALVVLHSALDIIKSKFGPVTWGTTIHLTPQVYVILPKGILICVGCNTMYCDSGDKNPYCDKCRATK